MLLDNPPPVIGFDFETISLEERVPIGLSIATSPTDAFYFPLYPERSSYLPWHILQNPKIKKVAHNIIFDLEIAGIEGVDLGPMDDSNIACTNVMAHLLNKPDTKLTNLAWEVGAEVSPASEYLTGKKTMLDLPEEEVADKCCRDSEIALALYLDWKDKIDPDYFSVEMQIIPILLRMSNRGVAIDEEVRKRLEIRFSKDVEYYRGLCEAEGFNPGSAQQVAYILAKRGNWLPINKSKRSLSTEESVLEKLDDPLAGLVLSYRDVSYFLSHYIIPLAGKDRAYTHFHLDAITGRVSSTKRNMQNIPQGEPRNMYLPDTGVFTDIDYSQVELRILAYLSQDPVMLDIFADPDGDIHQATADFLHIPRRGHVSSKNVNFAMIYGATEMTLSETAKIRDIGICRQLMNMWFTKFRRAGDFIRDTQQLGLKTGYIETIFGRKIKLPSVLEENEDGIKRRAINYPIQGSAAEILKRAMLKCKNLDMVLQVHDELLFDGNVVKELNSLGLENIAPLHTPTSVKVLKCWE